MSLVENLVEQLVSSRLNGITKPFEQNLNDTTFEKLLEKQLQEQSQTIGNIQPNQLGTPAGFEIEPFDPMQEDKQVNFKNINSIQEFAEPIEIKDVNVCETFSNFMKNSAKQNKNLFNFAIKNAANSYESFGRNCIDDIKDFVKDLSIASK